MKVVVEDSEGKIYIYHSINELITMLNAQFDLMNFELVEENKMTELGKVKSDAFEAISKYPHLEEVINDGYELMIDAINDGCSEEKAINDFYNWITEVTL